MFVFIIQHTLSISLMAYTFVTCNTKYQYQARVNGLRHSAAQYFSGIASSKLISQLVNVSILNDTTFSPLSLVFKTEFF